MKKATFLIFMCLVNILYAQVFNIKWSETFDKTKKEEINSIMKVDSNSIYYSCKRNRNTTFTYPGSEFKPAEFIVFNKIDVNSLNEKKDAVYIEEPELELLYRFQAKDYFILYYKKVDLKNKSISYYYSKMDLDFKYTKPQCYLTINDEDYLYSETFIIYSNDKNNVITIVQRNTQYKNEGYYSKAKLDFDKLFKRYEQESKQFFIVCQNGEGEKKWEKKIELKDNKEAYVRLNENNIVLQNNGDVFFYSIENKKTVSVPNNEFYLFRITNNGNTIMNSKYGLGENYINNNNNYLEISPINNRINFVGFYFHISGNLDKMFWTSEMIGIFSYMFDDKGSLFSNHVKIFSTSLLEKFKQNKLTYQGKNEKELLDQSFNINNFLFRSDSGSYFVTEHYGYYGENGITSDNLLIANIASDGTISNISTVPKIQYSGNYNKYYTTFTFINNDLLYMLFNDNKEVSEPKEKSKKVVKYQESNCVAYILNKDNKLIKKTVFENDDLIFEPTKSRERNGRIVLLKKSKSGDEQLGILSIK